ncbi:TRAP transporter small permease subunit [Thiohalocapsa marina]|uniref:TRAP transporter small permease protein n=1 Tax=Thiohalocapsa marina TaxID=424902 RepID=A0A5M8FK60_9GAMM|nr:TRAP transporter small permease subunit [Thiohalocapsa marina]KAA6184380.1 TRAP transporter small permease subunit [Thiohalocapsa marina]
MSDLQGFGFVLPHWAYWGWLMLMPPVLMLWSARSERRSAGGRSGRQPGTAGADPLEAVHEEDPTVAFAGNRFTRAIDWVSEQSGLFVAFWTINAVVAYFYEVVARYLFNAPTIWAHEGAYLLFGMQYLVAGGYALLHGAHVRVDVLYAKLPPRGRVGMDIFTSVFFFIFALALLGTGWTFFLDSYQMQEITVETWGIQHWPVKAVMVLGAVLLLLAGISRLTKDILLYRQLGRQPGRSAPSPGGASHD